MCGPNMVNLAGMVLEKRTESRKLDIVNSVVAAARKSNTYVSPSTTFVAGETKKIKAKLER
jgi:hypothetical protein